MHVGSFSVQINEGREVQGGYVQIPHGTQFTIRINNHQRRRCDAEVVVDGKPIGTFRLNGHGSCRLERSPEDNGRFTSYLSGTQDAAAAGDSAIAREEKGLIQVTFTPEKEYPQPVPTVRHMTSPRTGGGDVLRSSGGPRGQSMGAMPFVGEDEEKTSGGAVITGLSGHSDQQFTNVGPIEYDVSGRVVITLRLVGANDGPRPLKVQTVPVGNPVPPAV